MKTSLAWEELAFSQRPAPLRKPLVLRRWNEDDDAGHVGPWASILQEAFTPRPLRNDVVGTSDENIKVEEPAAKRVKLEALAEFLSEERGYGAA